MTTRRSTRGIAAAAAAALGVVLVAGGFLTPAGAQGPDLAVYGAQAVARGLETTLAVRPHTLEPLGDVATPFVATVMNAVPESNAVASLLWPGALPHSVVGEGGTANNQGAPAYPFTVEAKYPDRSSREKVLAGLFPLKEAGLTAEGGQMRALAELTENRARAAMTDLVLAPGGSDPIVSVDALQASADAVKKGARIGQTAVSRAEGIELLGGMIRIASMVSRVTLVSDGETVIEKAARLEIGRVEVLDDAGKPHGAVIDQEGIHIRDPDQPRDVNQALTAALRQTLGRAGITITALDATVTDEGANGQAFSGGLLFDFRSGGCDACTSLLGIVPPGTIPDEVFQTIEAITTRCETTQFGLPICFSLGLVPSTSNSLDGTITIGSTAAAVSAALGEGVGGAPGGPAFVSGPGTDVLGGGFAATPGGELGGGAVVQPPAAGGGAVAQPGQLFGLVSEIPSGALAGVGLGFLVLAVGLVLAPSFRP